MKIKKIMHTLFSRLKDWYRGGIDKDFRHNVIISDDGGLVVNMRLPYEYVRIRIDIGLSHNAPNSLNWLNKSKDLLVVGIEANKYNIRELNRKINNEWNDGKNNAAERFTLLYCAIDNSPTPTYAEFNHVTGDSGTSSLLSPTTELLEKNLYKVRETSMVPIVPLHEILSIVDWDRFGYVEVCKVDTQGKDLDVLKSAKDFIKKIAIVIAEVNTWGQYENAGTENEITTYMIENGFVIKKYIYDQYGGASDIIYVNMKYESNALKIIDEFA